MIYTVTLNPSIDYFITLNNALIINEVNRGKNEIFKAGGKGINVSKILNLLEIESKAIVLLGGFTGAFIKSSINDYPFIELLPIYIDKENRINIKAVYGNESVCINGEGPLADFKHEEMILNMLQNIKNSDYLIISGSMMKGIDYNFLLKISKIVHKIGAKLIVDMENLNLDLLNKLHPYLIKPNLYELQILFDDNSININNIELYIDKLKKNNVENILITFGKDGAVLFFNNKTYYLKQPDDILINKVGAGDAMLAAFIGKLSLGFKPKDAFRYGGATGNAVASKLEDITKEDIDKYLDVIDVITE